MKQNIFIVIMALSSIFAFSQVGVNTRNPQQLLHIDGASDNPTTGIPSLAQQANDFVVTATGSVGMGVVGPSVKLQIKSGTDGVSGLKFDNVNNATATTISGTSLLGVDVSGNVVVAENIPINAITGDIKRSIITADHNGWYLLDGRAVSDLPANAQAAANNLGFTSSIPDATDRVLKTNSGSETIGATGGANTLSIAQANLPSLNLSGTITGTAASAGAHTHTVTGTAASAGAHTHTVSGTAASAGSHSHSPSVGNAFLVAGTSNGNDGTGYADGTSNVAWGGTGASGIATSGAHTHTVSGTAASAGAHTHTVTGTAASAGAHTHTVSGTATVSTGGSDTTLDNRSPYLVVNTFIYLGQ